MNNKIRKALLLIFCATIILVNKVEAIGIEDAIKKEEKKSLSFFVCGGTSIFDNPYFYQNIGFRNVTKTIGETSFDFIFNFVHGVKTKDFTFYEKNDYAYKYRRMSLGIGFSMAYRFNRFCNLSLGTLFSRNYFRQELQTENEFLAMNLRRESKMSKNRLMFVFGQNIEISKNGSISFKLINHLNSLHVKNKIKNVLVHDLILTIGYERNIL